MGFLQDEKVPAVPHDDERREHLNHVPEAMSAMDPAATPSAMVTKTSARFQAMVI